MERTNKGTFNETKVKERLKKKKKKKVHKNNQRKKKKAR